MKKTFLLKTMLLLCALVVGSSAWAQSTYELVTSTSGLEDNGVYLIVSDETSDSYYALAGANTNNRKQTEVTVADGVVVVTPASATDSNAPFEITLKKSGDNWNLYDAINEGYLNGGSTKSSGNNNHLKTETSVVTETGQGKANGVWSISINATSHVASISNQNSFTIKYNSSSSLFASYSSGQTDVYLYKKIAASPLVSIALSGSYPTTFYVGDEFTHEGAVVTATYANSKTRIVTANASFSDPDMSTAGSKPITVSYTENGVTKTTTYNITVNELPTLQSLILSGTYTTTFDQFNSFNHDGLVVTAHFDDGLETIVTNDAEVSTPDMTTAGEKTVTVSYTIRGVTKSTTYNITVNAYVQPTSVTIDLTKSLWGETDDHTSGTASADLVFSGSQDNVTITYLVSKGSHYYYNSTQTRTYSGCTLKFDAPVGHVITSITFTSDGNNWNDATPTDGAMNSSNNKKWEGYAHSISFTWTTTTRIKSVAVNLSTTVPATITAAEYATFCNATTALDFSGTGIAVYTAKDNGSNVTLSEITSGKVPANTPVVLYKAGGTTINVPVIASAPAISGTNDLRVSDGTTTLTNAYVLAENPTIGFYLWGGTTLSAGKIYLQGSAPTRDFIGIGDASGISNVKVNTNLDGNYYDLQGRQVAQPTKGLYIVNGKKVFVK